MDCSICFEAISAETGRVELSCSHQYHYKCLTQWFYQQIDDGIPETCPYCRHAANEYEELPEYGEVEEEEEETVPVSAYDDLRRDWPEDRLKEYAATRIQAVMRAYWHRRAWLNHYSIVASRKYSAILIDRHTAKRDAYDRKLKFNRLSFEIPRAEWRNLCATMVQTIWRGYSSRREYKAWRSIRITWTNTGSGWVRTIYKENWDGVGLYPQTLAFETHSVIQRMQALWRGYSVRLKIKNLGNTWQKTGDVWTRIVMNPEEDVVVLDRRPTLGD